MTSLLTWLAATHRRAYAGAMPTVEPHRPDGAPYPVARSDDEWRAHLTPIEYAVLREAGTEPPWSGEYAETHAPGVYTCRACGIELFRSAEKFDSHCGWPSFFSPLAGDRVIEVADRSHGMVRTEVRCASCGSHLGHVFEGEGYPTPTDLRYCINSVCLVLQEEPAGDS